MAAEMPKDEKEAAQTQPQGEEYAQHVANHHMQRRRKKETECGEKNQAKLVNENARNAELRPPTTGIGARETKWFETVEAALKAQAYPELSSDQKSLLTTAKNQRHEERQELACTLSSQKWMNKANNQAECEDAEMMDRWMKMGATNRMEATESSTSRMIIKPPPEYMLMMRTAVRQGDQKTFMSMPDP